MGNLIRRRGGSNGGLYFTSPKAHLGFIHSGCALLDCVLGGGWPLGRMANIVGDKSTGKTLLAIEACANFLRQHHNGEVLYVEAEAAFDREYAAALGLPISRVQFEQGIGTVERLFGTIGQFIGAEITKDRKSASAPDFRKTPGLLIVDSLDALSDEAEAGRAISDGSFGAAKAKKMSELFRRLIRELSSTNTCMLIISQVRDNIGVTFGKKYTRSGGHALDFYAAQVLWLAHLKTITRVVNNQKRAIGVRVKAKCDKNKISLPYRECEFGIRFGYGVDDIEANVAFLESIGKAKRAPTLPDFKRARGKELTEMRKALEAAVIEEWYALEKGFVPERGKYQGEL